MAKKKLELSDEERERRSTRMRKVALDRAAKVKADKELNKVLESESTIKNVKIKDGMKWGLYYVNVLDGTGNTTGGCMNAKKNDMIQFLILHDQECWLPIEWVNERRIDCFTHGIPTQKHITDNPEKYEDNEVIAGTEDNLVPRFRFMAKFDEDLV